MKISKPSGHRVGCVVVTYNSARYIEDCLRAAHSAGVDRIIVWDNASEDDTVAVVASLDLPNTLLVKSKENVGFGKAVNASIRKFDDCTHYLLLNPDCRVQTDTVNELLAIIEADKHIGAVVPAMRYPNGGLGVPGGAFPSMLKELLAWSKLDLLINDKVRKRIAALLRKCRVGKSFWTHVSAVNATGLMKLDWASGYCLLVRDRAWQATCGFDERFFLYFEDVALGKRLADVGMSAAVAAGATVIHDESASARNNGKSRHYYHSMWQYFRHYGTTVQRTVAIALSRGS